MEREQHYLLMSEILDSFYCTLVVDADGKIAFLNKKYAEILGVDRNKAIGQPVEKIISNTRMPIVLKTGQEEVGSVFRLKNGEMIVCNRIPVRSNGQILGAVAMTTFTRMDELATFMQQIQQLNLELDIYKKELGKLRGAKYSFEQIIGSSPAITQLKSLAHKVSQTKSTILITGETGTGKEFFAHAIHHHSPRNHNPFIRLNCAAIPKDLLESELFGYEEGAFTGAKKGGKPGKFEQANAGTLLLDEINQLPLSLQSKLLRVIQEKELERVGGLRTIETDVRLICTTNQDLYELVRRGEFREDLYYRINVVELNIPPLRERIDDIPALVDYCISRINRELGLNILGVESGVLDFFRSYNWPGNVRELDHALERAANMALTGWLKQEHFGFLAQRIRNFHASINPAIDSTLESARANAEMSAIRHALAMAGGNKSVAAEILKVDRGVLYEKAKKYGLFPSENTSGNKR